MIYIYIENKEIIRKKLKVMEIFTFIFFLSLKAQWIENAPALQETQEMGVQSLDQEDSLE